MKIALIHDYLSQNGGAERVLKAMHEIWPDAPIFVLFYDQNKVKGFEKSDVKETFLKNLPGVKNYYEWYLPFMPGATERHNLGGIEVAISSTSGFAKGIITDPDTLHICYCHTPPRFLWSGTHRYVSDLRYNFLVKSFLPPLLHRLRLWDTLSTNRVDHFIANSQTVKQRINKYYRRESEVIYPPVATEKFYISQNLGDYFVAGGRLVPYKRLDLVIKAFNRLGYPLKIFGTGPEEKYLRSIAKPNIEFLGNISEENKIKLLSEARAFINPQMEDFGIVAVEAQAAGRPVIAFAQGGATESVIDKETGVFFYEQSWEAILNTVLNFSPFAWDQTKIKAHAEKFNTNAFKLSIKKFVEDRYEEFSHGLNQPELLK